MENKALEIYSTKVVGGSKKKKKRKYHTWFGQHRKVQLTNNPNQIRMKTYIKIG